MTKRTIVKDSFAWGEPSKVESYMLVVEGDVISLSTQMEDKLHELYGKSQEEIKAYFNDMFDRATNLVLGKTNSPVVAAYESVAGDQDRNFFREQGVIAGCALLSNPHLVNLRLPNQFLVSSVKGNVFKVRFFDHNLEERWAKEEKAKEVIAFMVDREFTMGDKTYFKMGCAF